MERRVLCIHPLLIIIMHRMHRMHIIHIMHIINIGYNNQLKSRLCVNTRTHTHTYIYMYILNNISYILVYICPINPLYHHVISCANPMPNQRQIGHLFSDCSSRCSRSCTQQLPGCFSGCQSYANISGLGGLNDRFCWGRTSAQTSHR